MQKLFYENIHLVDFTATVTACFPAEAENQYNIVLDQTAFFPEEGGQLADKGTLAGMEVVDVQISNNLIYHILSAPLSVGSTVSGCVDWEQRFDFMQQHSGEHIISGLIHSHFGLDNVGFHLGLSEVTMDMNGELTWEQLRFIEQEANKVVWQNLPIIITYPSTQELAALEYRSKLELTEDVRIVDIPGVDRCACCAPHVDSTGQIGLIKITGFMRHRGGVRINILCGGRALADYQEKQTSVTDISVQLSAKANGVSDAVNRLREENQRLKEQATTLQIKLLDLALETLPDPSESDHALLFVEDINDITMRNAVNSLVTKYSGYCGIFAGNDEKGYRFIIGSSTKDCRKLATLLRETLHAKGGGSEPMIQGSVQADCLSIKSFFE